MSNFLRHLLFLTLMLTVSSVNADNESLKNLMSAEDFKAAGLDKLSAEELNALGRWLDQYQKQGSAPLDQTIVNVPPPAPVPMVAPVAGDPAPSEATAVATEERVRQAEQEAEQARAEVQRLEQRIAEIEQEKTDAEQRAEDIEEQYVPPEQVSGRIVGRFEGWTGKTYFPLDNGQIWRQRTRGSYRWIADAPEVEITRGLFGTYNLTVKETGRSIGVTRLQ